MPTFAESIAAGGRVVGHDRQGEPVEIAGYDAAWPKRFDEMRRQLAAVLGDLAIRIDHVGSTAVPGLAAKPVIDIQVSVPDVEDEDAFRAAIEGLGFELRWTEPGHRYFRPPPGLPRLHQIHVCSHASPWERVHVLFRDYLRAHPDVAARYVAIKRDVATQHPRDRVAYNDAKAPFIDVTVRDAEEWAAATDWSLDDTTPDAQQAVGRRAP